MIEMKKEKKRWRPDRRIFRLLVAGVFVALAVTAFMQCGGNNTSYDLADDMSGTWTGGRIELFEPLEISQAGEMSTRYGEKPDARLISYSPTLTFVADSGLSGGSAIFSAKVRGAVPCTVTDSTDNDRRFRAEVRGAAVVSFPCSWIAHKGGKVTLIVDPDAMTVDMDSASVALKSLSARDTTGLCFDSIAPAYIPLLDMALGIRVKKEISQMESLSGVRAEDRRLSLNLGNRVLVFDKLHPTDGVK